MVLVRVRVSVEIATPNKYAHWIIIEMFNISRTCYKDFAEYTTYIDAYILPDTGFVSYTHLANSKNTFDSVQFM